MSRGRKLERGSKRTCPGQAVRHLVVRSCHRNWGPDASGRPCRCARWSDECRRTSAASSNPSRARTRSDKRMVCRPREYAYSRRSPRATTLKKRQPVWSVSRVRRRGGGHASSPAAPTLRRARCIVPVDSHAFQCGSHGKRLNTQLLPFRERTPAADRTAFAGAGTAVKHIYLDTRKFMLNSYHSAKKVARLLYAFTAQRAR